MTIPINSLQYYFGLPVVIGLVLIGLLRWRANNKLSQQLTIAAIFATLSFLVYSILPIVTHESDILTYSFIVGDVFIFLSIYWIWQAMIRVYLTNKPTAQIIIKFLTTLYLVLMCSVSIKANLSDKSYMQLTEEGWRIHYAFPHYYQILNSIYFVAFILLGLYFLRAINNIDGRLQKWRLLVYGLFFIGIGISDIITPFLTNAINSSIRVAGLVACFLVLGIFLIASKFVKQKSALKSHK